MIRKILLCAGFILATAFAKAQLGFCSGQSGDAIFTETFGQGTTNGPALAQSVTTYTYVNNGVQDGEYTISSNMQQLGSFWDAPDHTGDQDGRMLIVNADFFAGTFYQIPITGLCENTPYEFSSWVINVLGANNPCVGIEIPVQVRFQIWDSTDTNLLADGVMPERFADASPTWVQYGLTFTTAPGQNGCILKLINEGVGGCGNDLAIDDIEFRPCGDATSVVDTNGGAQEILCEEDPDQRITLNANAASSVYASPEYQWQESTDGVNFTDIPGANSSSFTSAILSNTTFFRVKVAEDAVNLSNAQCVNFSSPFEFRKLVVNPPNAVANTVVVCDGQSTDLEVNPTAGIRVNWYDSPSASSAVASNTNTFSPSGPGLYYAEAEDITTGCLSSSRTLFDYQVSDSPDVNSANFTICPESTIVLDPVEAGMMYDWSTGADTRTIEVGSPGLYTCVVSNAAGCSALASFNISLVETPIIESLSLIGEELSINTTNPAGDFLYSIDNINFSRDNTFDVSSLLQVTAYVRDASGCVTVTDQLNRIIIPKFFTPNQDGYHDTFQVYGIEAFPDARLEIFDRYGKLIKQINDLSIGWDGTYLNQALPSADYWFKLYYQEQIITGHFAMKR